VLAFDRDDNCEISGRIRLEDLQLGLTALEVSGQSFERLRPARAEVERDVHVDPNAKQQEIWLRDPDGYRVVLAGSSAHRPRA
jgi:hypothetical protein